LKQEYRISSWRFDVLKHAYSSPTFEGETVEDCDAKALEHFQEVSSMESNQWDGMDIVRIDARAVAEKTSFLHKNGRQESDND
jgi:hypothetical protein